MIDLASFRLIVAAVLDENLAGRAAPADDVLLVADQVRELVAELAERRDRRRPTTRQISARLTTLERQLSDRDPGERADIVRRRLGLSRSTYYRLRRESQSQVGLSSDSMRSTARGAPRGPA